MASPSVEVLITETFSVSGSTTTFVLTLWVDGVLSGTATDSIPTASLVASSEHLVLGAKRGSNGTYSQHFSGAISGARLF